MSVTDFVFASVVYFNTTPLTTIARNSLELFVTVPVSLIVNSARCVLLILSKIAFPDVPCGADGKNCPAPNQGDLNCQANSAVCAAQDTTGNNIDTAFLFWGAFAKKYTADPAVLYDTWEDMHGIDGATWSNDQNELIAAIRTYSPQSLIFVEDTGTAFESIVSGALAGLGLV